jgi:hypothetical protein
VFDLRPALRPKPTRNDVVTDRRRCGHPKVMSRGVSAHQSATK